MSSLPKKLLVPVDFSSTSLAALAFAHALARRFGGSLELIHAWQIPVVPLPEGAAVFGPEAIEEIRSSIVNEMHETARGYADAAKIPGAPPPVPLHEHVIEGDPSRVLVEQAAAQKCDAIVMGTHGRTGLSRALLGSVAERVVRLSPVPVFVVPPPKVEGKALPEPNLKKIVCPVDFSTSSDGAFRYALLLARAAGAEVHLVHVWQLSPYSSRHSELAVKYERDLARDLEGLAHRYAGAEDKVARHLREGVPYVEILEAVKALGADLVVLGTQGRTGLEHFLLGSVAERVVRSCPVPVVTVRVPA